jgi:conjugal transfer mating pair stabilization protein TraN
MDLSEFYASLVAKSPNLSAIQTNNGARVPSCYFGQGKC